MKSIKYQFISYLWVSLFLVFLITSLIVFTLRNRSVPGSKFFFITLILVEIWIVAQAFEMAALDLNIKLIWANIQYIPIMLTPLTYLYLTLQFTRREKWLKRQWLHLVLLIVPVVMNILLWTNEYHGLIRQNIILNSTGPFPTVGKTFGPLFWFFAFYNYVIIGITFVNLANTLRDKVSIYRNQILSLIVALLLPCIANILHMTRLNPFNVDTTPVFFGLSALIIFWGIFRYDLFDVVPIARSIIIQEMQTGMIVLDNDGRILDINPAAIKMLSLSSEKIIGKSFATMLGGAPDLIDMWAKNVDSVCEVTIKNNKTIYFYEVSIIQIKNADNQIGRLLQIYDITERKMAEKVIQHAAFHDSLTGLPNRRHFYNLFSQALAKARVHSDKLTIAFLDLDDFKIINDTYGHDIGDKVLFEVAKRIKDVLRESDIISRVGGDEFAFAFPNVGNDDKIAFIGVKISAAIGKGIQIDDKLITIKVSIGFSVYPRDGDNIEILLKKADQAMYLAKNNKNINYSIYKET